MSIPPEICCPTCVIAANPNTPNASDFKCAKCTARNAIRSAVKVALMFGDREHAERVKHEMFHLLLEDMKK